MDYLIDTNVLSELRRESCDQKVRAYVDTLPTRDTCISVISLGELSKGVHLLHEGKKLKNPWGD
jgi:predicted nucleic acid-binding protein